VAELTRRMPERELSEWMAFAHLEPFGEARADLRAGIIASTIANVHRGKRSKAFKPEDFVPRFDSSDHGEPDDVNTQVRKLLEDFL